MDTKELCDLLGVSKEGLKSILRRDQLKERLLLKNYELLSVEKRGRSKFYNVREVVVIPKKTWEEIRKEDFPNVRKVKQFEIHAKERLINGTVFPKDIMDKTGVVRKTSNDWDGLLVKKKYMTNNGYSYYRISNNTLEEITYEEYSKYWEIINVKKKRPHTKRILSLVEGEGEITERDIELASKGLCIKVKSYLLQQFTEEYQALIEALKG